MALQSIENKVLSAINRKKTAIYYLRVADMGESKAINKAFERASVRATESNGENIPNASGTSTHSVATAAG